MRTLVALAAAASVGLQAAPAAAQQIRVQPQVGVNFANVSEVSELAAGFGIDTKMRIAFHGGVGILFGLSEQLSIGTGGYYSQQGLKLTATGEPDVTLKLDYVKVPLTLSAAFPSGGGVTPFVFAGPMVGFKAACKVSGGSVDRLRCGRSLREEHRFRRALRRRDRDPGRDGDGNVERLVQPRADQHR